MEIQAQYLFAVLYENEKQDHVYSTSRCASTVPIMLEEMYGDDVPTIREIRRLPVTIESNRKGTGVLVEVE